MMRTVMGARTCFAYRRRGTALLEFALVLVTLLLLTLGLVQYSILANTSMSLAQVAREGGRYAAVNHSKGDSDIKDYVKTTAQNYNLMVIPDEDIIITRPASPDQNKAGEPIIIDVTYDLGNVLFLPGEFNLPGGHTFRFAPSEKTVRSSYMME